MKLLMISGDRSILQRKQGAFWHTLQELRKHWDRIDIICPRVDVLRSQSGQGTTPAGESSLMGGSVYFHPCSHGLHRQPTWIYKKGKELIETFGHEVMTVHEYPPFYNGIGARRLSKATSIPYAIEVHHIVGSPRSASMQEWIGKILSRLYIPRSAHHAHAVRVVNETARSQLVSWGVPEKKIHFVPSFYLDRAILNCEKRPAIVYDVSFAARLMPNKGLKNLLYAIHKISKASLLVIGDGPMRKEAEALTRELGIADRVTFLGWMQTLEGVAGAVQTAHIFVMNSMSEGGPRSALEAMACGMPVISTPVGVMPYVIKDGVNGFFTTGEPNDLAEKISHLLSDDALRGRIGNEATNILDRFEKTALVKEYADFLKSLV